MPVYQYDDRERPTVGGWSCAFPAMFRSIGRDFAIAATQRVLAREKYEPTGDVAFDLRAKAFRNALMRGTREAFAESHEAFQSVGLYDLC